MLYTLQINIIDVYHNIFIYYIMYTIYYILQINIMCILYTIYYTIYYIMLLYDVYPQEISTSEQARSELPGRRAHHSSRWLHLGVSAERTTQRPRGLNHKKPWNLTGLPWITVDYEMT